MGRLSLPTTTTTTTTQASQLAESQLESSCPAKPTLPAALQAEWSVHWSNRHNRWYRFHHPTGLSRWHHVPKEEKTQQQQQQKQKQKQKQRTTIAALPFRSRPGAAEGFSKKEWAAQSFFRPRALEQMGESDGGWQVRMPQAHEVNAIVEHEMLIVARARYGQINEQPIESLAALNDEQLSAVRAAYIADSTYDATNDSSGLSAAVLQQVSAKVTSAVAASRDGITGPVARAAAAAEDARREATPPVIEFTDAAAVYRCRTCGSELRTHKCDRCGLEHASGPLRPAVEDVQVATWADEYERRIQQRQRKAADELADANLRGYIPYEKARQLHGEIHAGMELAPHDPDRARRHAEGYPERGGLPGSYIPTYSDEAGLQRPVWQTVPDLAAAAAPPPDNSDDEARRRGRRARSERPRSIGTRSSR